jgi:hypothetical protein
VLHKHCFIKHYAATHLDESLTQIELVGVFEKENFTNEVLEEILVFLEFSKNVFDCFGSFDTNLCYLILA